VKAKHLEILVEEPSMEAFLQQLLPRLLADRASFRIHVFQDKDDLVSKLEPRLRGYADWLPEHWRIVVLVDRDDDSCDELKQRMEAAAERAGFDTRTRVGRVIWQVVNRIAVEELEAWYFGDWNAVCEEFPGVPEGIPRKSAYRDCDAIAGGTWEALERILQRAGYFAGGLRKIELAHVIGLRINPDANTSRSFCMLRDVLAEAIT